MVSENANDTTASIAGSVNTYQPMSRPQIGSVWPNGVRWSAWSAVFHCEAIASATTKETSAVHGSASARITRAACAPMAEASCETSVIGSRTRISPTTSPRSA